MNNNSGENTYYGSTDQLQPEDQKFTPRVIKNTFTEEELERYNQLRRQGYVSEQPSAIEVGGFKIYVNKINLMALEDLMVKCCEEYLYPTKLTWADLYKVKNKLKEDIPALQFLNLDHLLYADLSFLEHLLNNQRYSEMQIMKLLSEARKLRGLEPVALDGAPETDHTENKPAAQQAALSEKQYTVLYEALKSEIRREVKHELAKEKILQEQIPMQNTKLVFLVMVDRFNNEEKGYIWPGGKCSPEFLNLLRTQTQEKYFYIQITPFDALLPFKFTRAGVYGYDPFFLESDRSVLLPDYICGFLHTKYRWYHEFYLGLQPDANNEFSLDYLPLDKKWESK